jgi:glycine cleavage system H protein
MTVPSDLFFMESHEWIRVDGDIATIGISDHAQAELGDVVDFNPPDVGDTLVKGDALGEVESVKAVSDVYVPLSGEVVEINESLDDAPENVNDDPYGEGWMVKLRISDASELDSLLSSSDYASSLD